MVKFLHFISELFNSFNLLLTVLSRPNPNHIPNKTEFEVTHMRCKALLTIYLALILYSLVDALLTGFSTTASLIRCCFCMAVCGLLILSCRSYMYIFNIAYNLFCLSYGPYIMNMGEGGVQRAWFLALLFPIYSYVFIGDWKLYMFHTGIQMVYVNKLFYPIMEQAATYMSPDVFVRDMAYSTNMVFVFFIILILINHYFMQHAYKKIAFAEKKKEEFEKQKNFLLGFSHELRNLINSLTGNVKLASLEAVTSRTKELLQNAEVCGELLLHLVNNILDTAKVEIGELEINPVPTRIFETLERIWGICSELIKNKHLAGKIRISKNLPLNLSIDHYRLTQIFLNLVGNAIKFTEKGLIDISIEWLSNRHTVDESCFQPYPFNDDEGLFEKQRALGNLDKNSFILGLMPQKVNTNLIRRSVSTSNRGVLKIVVSDTGFGMSQEELKKLFQKFTQVTSDTSQRKLGTGLGLFITKELCQKMNGDIKAFSKKGSGSSFILCIPVDVVQEEQNAQAQDLESLKEFVRSLNLKAMIVDDALFNHAVLKNFFIKLGVEVIDIASNGLEAYQKFSQRIERGDHFDVVTMDLEMPVLDGKEAAKKIRKLEAEKGIRPCFMPIISANCSESEIAECLNKNGDIKADRFIKKPTTLDELLRAIGNHFTSLRS